jgi:hypothetical protein
MLDIDMDLIQLHPRLSSALTSLTALCPASGISPICTHTSIWRTAIQEIPDCPMREEWIGSTNLDLGQKFPASRSIYLRHPLDSACWIMAVDMHMRTYKYDDASRTAGILTQNSPTRTATHLTQSKNTSNTKLGSSATEHRKLASASVQTLKTDIQKCQAEFTRDTV